MKNIKVGKSKMRGHILNNVTALISEQFLKSCLDDSSCANLSKRVLQKAEAVLEPCNAPSQVQVIVSKFGIGFF